LGDRANDSTSRVETLGKRYWWDLGEYAYFLPSMVYFPFCMRTDAPFRLQSDLDLYAVLDGLRDYAVQ
jgi:hypothetical protein